MENRIGAAWLVQRYSLQLAQPLASVSEIGSRRATHVQADGARRETYVPAMRPEASLKGHLTFHLKHEEPHLELLARLFVALDPSELVAWFRAEPTGQYSRRACFQYEWLTNKRLEVDGATQGAYVDALDADAVVVASANKVSLAKRWRVRDNMPGSPAFCPLIRKIPQAAQAMLLVIPKLLAELSDEFGEEVLMKSAVWMTLRESKSSFVIEGEGDQGDRIQRFANVLGRRTGQGEVPLTEGALAEIQAEILGKRTTLKQFGLRRSPVFVGESVRFQEVVHYIAPPPEDLEPMLRGLQVFLDRTEGQSPVLRSAVAAFGFVYIHPLADGNGRVHRFLVNDVLRRGGVVKDPLILPISSLITSDSRERRGYDRVLEEVSRPLMALIAGRFKFGHPVTYPDGIASNLHFDDFELARPLWRTPDLTRHVVYLSDVIARTIGDDMRQESRYLRAHARARAAIKDVIEMPDAQVDRVIRSIEANQGMLTHVLAKEIPELTAEGVWDGIIAGVRRAFADAPPGHAVGTMRSKPPTGQGHA